MYKTFNLVPRPFSVACACRDKVGEICSWIEDQWFDFRARSYRLKFDMRKLRDFLADDRDIWISCTACETFTPLDRSVLQGMCEEFGTTTEVSLSCPHCGSGDLSVRLPSSEVAQQLLSGAKDQKRIAWEAWFALLDEHNHAGEG